jgi:hypothetical protein
MTGTALVSYQERFTQDAQALAERSARGAGSLSTQGGVFSLAGETLGNKVAVVVIDSWFVNEYYPPENGPFDRNNPMPPTCYAFARGKHELAPSPTMQVDLGYFKPENGACAGCPRNEWGSASQGKGKACKNRVKLAVLPAGYYAAPRPRAAPELNLFEDPAHFSKADAVLCNVPTTSVENWSKYVIQLSAAHRRPPYAVFTEMSLVPDPKSQYKMQFDLIELCPEGLFETLTRRVDTQLSQPFAGYQAPDAEARSPLMASVRTAAQGPRGRR